MQYAGWKAILAFVLFLGITSCSSSDDDSSGGGNGCSKTITNQIAQGSFMGTTFTSQGGVYRDQSFGDETRFFCTINVKSPTGGSCFFPEFEGDDDTILFSIDSLDAQTFDVTDEFSTDGSIPKTLSFNRITSENGESLTINELSCGRIVIDGLNDSDQLTGSVVATGLEGSLINGNFVLDLCEF